MIRSDSTPSFSLRAGCPVFTGLLAFLFYAVTHLRGYMPGESAFGVTQALPEAMFPTFGHTLWHALVRWLAAWPGGALSARLGLFSALCGGLSVYALTLLAFRIPVGLSPEEERSPANPRLIRALIVSCALITYLFSPPIRFAATRPLPQMFGLTLLLLTGAWTVVTFQERSSRMLHASAIFWGLLVTEYATAWFFTPFFFGMVLLTGFTPDGNFRVWRNLRILLLFVAAAGLGYFLMAWVVHGHRHAPLQQIHTLAGAFRDSLAVQKSLIESAAPLRGSLLILILFGGPFLVAFTPKMQGTLEVRIGSVMMHLACAITCGILLFHPQFSPWGMYETGRLGVFMVAPSAMLSLSTGYLAGYWAGVLAKYDPFQPTMLKVTRYTLRLLVLPIIALVVLGSTGLNLWHHSDADAREVNRLAAEMAAALSDRDMYVGHTGFNHVLRLHLRDIGAETQVLDMEPRLWARDAFRAIIARQFEEENPRLASMARIGFGPFLQTWMQLDPEFHTRVLVEDMDDLIRRAGLQALPVPYGYIAVEQVTPERLAASYKALRVEVTQVQDALWERIQNPRARGRASAALASHYARESRRLNNLGYLLEAHGMDEEAFTAYRAARKARPDNISALLNLAMRAGDLSESARAQVEAEMEAFARQLGDERLNMSHLWRLSAHYGHVRHPQMLMQRGWAWVVSGNPQMAVPDLREALERYPGAEALRIRLAYSLFAGRDLDASESEYLGILAENPDSAAALLGMARVTGMRGQTDEAMTYLARLESLGVDPGVLYAEKVAILMVAGHYEAAVTHADTWMRAAPNSTRAVLSRLLIAQAMAEPEKMAQLMKVLDEMPDLGVGEQLLLADSLIRSGETGLARTRLRRLTEQHEGRMQALEMSLRLEVAERNRSEAAKLVSSILSVDPSHAFANYILGSLRLDAGSVREAIAAYETSVRSQPTPGALNDLAYTLLDYGQPGEALPYIEQALALQPQSAQVHGNHAQILLALGQKDAAMTAVGTALSISPDHANLLVTLGEVYLARDQRAEAREIIDQLMPEMSRMAPDTLRRFQQFSERAR